MAYYEIPGRTTAIDQNGKTVITVTYIGDQEAPNPGLGTLRAKSVTQDVAGQIRTQYQIEVPEAELGNDTPYEQAIIEIVAAVQTVPIEAHPNFSEPFCNPAM